MQLYQRVLVLIALSVISAYGQQRPDFTGTWKRVDNSSNTNRVEIDKIEHQDPHLKVATDTRGTIITSLPRVPSAASGHDEHEYHIEGEHAGKDDNGRQWWTTVYWQGSLLVFQSVVKDGYHVTVTWESWTLSAAGETLTKTRRIVNMDGVTEKTLTFQKQ
jgi:hypothetical protein